MKNVREKLISLLGLCSDEKTVAMHISKIRRKLGDHSKHPTIIINMRGLGYKFIPPIKREQ